MRALGKLRLILGYCQPSTVTLAEMCIIFSTVSSWSLCVTTTFYRLNHMASVPYFVCKTSLALFLDCGDKGKISPFRQIPRTSQVALVVKNLPANAGDAGVAGLNPGRQDPLE